MNKYISWAKNIGVVTLYGSLFFFLILNIVYSQAFSSLYFRIAKDEPQALVEFMKQGKDLPVFSSLLPEIQESYDSHNSQIYQEERQRTDTIQKLELLLEQNSRATEVLFSLHLLYKKDGDQVKADHYLRRAQELDPTLGE